jgi:hypothetical protein
MIVFVTKVDRLIGHILLMRNSELSFIYRNLKETSQQRGILHSIEFSKVPLVFRFDEFCVN